MNILVIPTWYPNGKDKLMGIYHKEFTEALNSFDISANMLYIDRQRLNNPIKYLFMKKKIISKEINYETYIYRMLNLSKINYDLQLKLYVRKLDKAFRDYLKYNKKPDIIHAHVTIPAGYAACIIGKKYNIPVIVTEHYSSFEKFFTNKDLKKYSNVVLEYATFSTVSKYMRNIILNYTDNCYVIPNLVNTTPFNNNVKRNVKKTFKLVIICALREGKRIDVALNAIKILVAKGMDIHLDIIGDGFYENYFISVCNGLNLNKYVSFLGRKNKFEIIEILKKEHALLISSELESFGIPGIEAMASGLPIISTDCLGPTEYIDNKVGVICKVNNPTDMAAAINKLYNNYDKYDNEYIIKKANNYNKDIVIKNTLEIYNKILKKNN